MCEQWTPDVKKKNTNHNRRD